jgi:hypothetical protein
MNNFQDYLAEYQQSISDPEKFWASQADNFVWKKKWSSVLQWDFHKPEVKWFIGGKLNITENRPTFTPACQSNCYPVGIERSQRAISKYNLSATTRAGEQSGQYAEIAWCKKRRSGLHLYADGS